MELVFKNIVTDLNIEACLYTIDSRPKHQSVQSVCSVVVVLVLGGECILFYSPSAVLCCAVLLRRVQLWSDTLISQCCSPAAQSSRAGK